MSIYEGLTEQDFYRMVDLNNRIIWETMPPEIKDQIRREG